MTISTSLGDAQALRAQRCFNAAFKLGRAEHFMAAEGLLHRGRQVLGLQRQEPQWAARIGYLEGALDYFRGDTASALERTRAAAAQAAVLGDPDLCGRCEGLAAVQCVQLDRPAEAVRLAALALQRPSVRRHPGHYFALMALATLCLTHGERRDAWRLFGAAMVEARLNGDSKGSAAAVARMSHGQALAVLLDDADGQDDTEALKQALVGILTSIRMDASAGFAPEQLTHVLAAALQRRLGNARAALKLVQACPPAAIESDNPVLGTCRLFEECLCLLALGGVDDARREVDRADWPVPGEPGGALGTLRALALTSGAAVLDGLSMPETARMADVARQARRDLRSRGACALPELAALLREPRMASLLGN
ncbi:MAG: hypothetical protein ACKVQR_22635 [Aquabacterium sp.]